MPRSMCSGSTSQSLLLQVGLLTAQERYGFGARQLSQSLLLQVGLLTAEVGETGEMQVSIPSSSGRSSNGLGAYGISEDHPVSIPSSSGRSSNDSWRGDFELRFPSQSLLLQVGLLTTPSRQTWKMPAVSIPSSSGRSSNGRSRVQLQPRECLNPFFFRSVF